MKTSELPQDTCSLTALAYQLMERIEKLEAENAALRKENVQLRGKNKGLKARLAQNSSNSYKPSSQEGHQNKPALPKAGGRKQKTAVVFPLASLLRYNTDKGDWL